VLIGRQHGGEQRAALNTLKCCATEQKNTIDSSRSGGGSCPREKRLARQSGGLGSLAGPVLVRRAAQRIFAFEKSRGRELRLRAALTPSAAQGWSVRSPHIEEDYREDG